MENKSVYSIILSNKAEKEILRSWEWYEERQAGLGDRFIEEVKLKINKIKHNPELYALKHKLFRETRIDIFPVLIIFKVNKKKKIIKIDSVFHTSQNPNKKYIP